MLEDRCEGGEEWGGGVSWRGGGDRVRRGGRGGEEK